MPRMSPPTRSLRERPDLDQLRRQAKELLTAFSAGDATAVEEVSAHYHGADPSNFALHDAQLVLARAHGFESWSKLKAYVDGITLSRLIDAVRRGDTSRVRAMLDVRPELVHLEVAEHDEHTALHHAVLERAPEMVRLLMDRGADSRKGIYPHRDATSALVMAIDRGYDEIVQIIQDAEARRRPAESGSDGGAGTSPVPATSIVRSAVIRGNAAWIRERHAQLAGSPEEYAAEFGSGAGLLTLAVEHDRADILAVLLDLGLDPDERTRLGNVEEVVYTAGKPLWICASTGKLAMAELLLRRGADPNAQVYASGSAVYRAWVVGDEAMIELLERHGGVLDAVTAGILHLTERARDMLEDDAGGRLRDGTVLGMLGGTAVAEDLLWGAASAGGVEIVRMALAHIDWPRDDPRWYTMLREPMYVGTRRSTPEREAFLECFRLILARADAGVQGSRARGWAGSRTLLHDLSASRHDMLPEDRVTIAAMLLDAGARLDARDDLLRSTPLGWACRWGRAELVELLLARGADPVEADAEPWATPRAWAAKRGHRGVLALLERVETGGATGSSR